MGQKLAPKSQRTNSNQRRQGASKPNPLLVLIPIIIVIVVVIIMITNSGDKNNNNGEPKINFKFEKAVESVLSLNNEEVNEMHSIDNIDEFGILKENLEKYIFYYNEETKDWWAIFKPISGKEEIVKIEVESYMQSMNWEDDLTIVSKYVGAIQQEIDGYLIYVATTSQNAPIMRKIQASGDVTD